MVLTEYPQPDEWRDMDDEPLTEEEMQRVFKAKREPPVEKPVDDKLYPRCPYCLGHIEECTDVPANQRGMYYDCSRCGVRVKLWKYFKGMP